MAEGGNDLSAGTRQLLVLARALLRRSRILLLDEATANVDFATDVTIQRVLREEFGASTIVAVAHRLDTVIDYDRVIFLADGRVAESGPPDELLAAQDSLFSGLVRDAGEQASQRLRELALEAARTRRELRTRVAL